jgi:acyl transferase domain-containing protein
VDGNTHATATVSCFAAARLYRLETALRVAARLSDDENTVLQLADLAIRVQRRRHAHEDFCTVCLEAGA